MKDIVSITTHKPADLFVIKWRITRLCNLHCDYCIQSNARVRATPELVAAETEKLIKTASEINKLIDRLPGKFARVKIELIGGEVSLFDLQGILSRIASKRLSIVQMTTNFMRGLNYYTDLACWLASRSVEFQMAASWHDAQTSDSYFAKAEAVAPYCRLVCECVSTDSNRSKVEQFIERSKALGLCYSVDADLRISSTPARISKTLVNTSTESRSPRLTVAFRTVYGTLGQKDYRTRNALINSCEYHQNVQKKFIASRGFLCTNSSDFINIKINRVIGRTPGSDDCKNKIKISEFTVVEPRPCVHEVCTLCGQMSLFRNSPAERQ